jgi:pimeloyl-ACP methyl ester carboxylesterase
MRLQRHLYSPPMSFEPPPDPRTERRTRIGQWAGFGFAALLVVLIVYLAYVGYEGSRQLTDAPDDSTDCRTPAAFGWTYEAINYPIDTDAALEAEQDPTDCSAQGAPAGDSLESADGTNLAGWYIPSGSETGPTGPTVVLVHGWGSNKSAMLDRAAVLHDRYNLLILDLRNHGQSEAAPTTQGLRETSDVEAAVDWLESTKAPEQIALLGVSMGGVTALNTADGDERIDAVIIESTHATMANAIQARLEQAGYPLSLPGSWAVLLGTLARTGLDISSADAVQAIERLDDRPVLIVTGGQDDAIGEHDGDDLLAAAEEAGTPAELEICEEAGHAESLEDCPEDYADWMLGFLERALAPAG